MPARDDYILRFLDLLRQALSEALRLRNSGQHEQALLALLIAQEKLFARPAPEFISKPIDEQLQMLRFGESTAGASAKVLGYASLLREAGLVYESRDRPDLAGSAFQLALHVTLSAAVEAPESERQDILPQARDLLARVQPDDLHQPVRDLLQRLGGA